MLDRVRDIAFERKHRITIIAAFLHQAQRKALFRFCNILGADFLAIVFNNDDRDITIGKHDGHLNPKAHRLIAEQLMSFLETRVIKEKGGR